MEPENYTGLDVDRVKQKSSSIKKAERYLCLTPEIEPTGPFASSWMQVHSRRMMPAYWWVYTESQNGYRDAAERYALPRVRGNKWPKSLREKD